MKKSIIIVAMLFCGCRSVMVAKRAPDPPAIGYSGFFTAIKNGDAAAVCTALDERPDLANAKTSEGLPMIHLAVAARQPKTLAVLLQRNADVDAVDSDKETALQLASFIGADDCVRILLSSKANVNAADAKKQTALHKSVVQGHENIARMLLKAAANVNAMDAFGYTPLHLAVIKQDARMARLLILLGADVKAKDSYGRIPLEYAMSQWH